MAAVPETAAVVEDLTETAWRDDQWLQFYPLNTFTALDYFSMSPFFVRGCNNELARMQGLDPSKMGILPAGIEYVVQDAQEPHLFVIRRQYRSSSKVTAQQAFYYILDGSIYQSPSLHAALSARLSRCLHSLQQAFQKMQVDLDPLMKGQQAAPGVDQAEEGPSEVSVVVAPSRKGHAEEREQMAIADRVILEVLRQFPTPAIPAPVKDPLAKALAADSQNDTPDPLGKHRHSDSAAQVVPLGGLK